MEPEGFEPSTPTLPVLCAPNCATAPKIYLLTFAILEYKMLSVNLKIYAGMAKWQTQQPQKLPSASSCGFKSLSRYFFVVLPPGYTKLAGFRIEMQCDNTGNSLLRHYFNIIQRQAIIAERILMETLEGEHFLRFSNYSIQIFHSRNRTKICSGS